MVKKTRSLKAKDVSDGDDELFTGGNEEISWKKSTIHLSNLTTKSPQTTMIKTTK
jgi:hypothetical protein